MEEDYRDWFYCHACMRAYPIDEAREDGQLCAYDDCTATIRDAIAWNDARAMNETLPDVPEREYIYEV